MTVFSIARKLLFKAATEAVSRHVSYDREKRVLKIGHGIVALAARRSLKKADRIEEMEMEVEDGVYRLHLTTDQGIRARIRMVPRQLDLKKDRVLITIRLPDGVRFEHESAVFGYMVRFVDKIFGISGEQMSAMDDVDYDGKETLTWTRRLEDFPLARVYRKYVGEGRQLPIEVGADHLLLDLSSMFAKGEKVDVKDLVVPPNEGR
jgi:hypothetical protein